MAELDKLLSNIPEEHRIDYLIGMWDFCIGNFNNPIVQSLEHWVERELGDFVYYCHKYDYLNLNFFLNEFETVTQIEKEQIKLRLI